MKIFKIFALILIYNCIFISCSESIHQEPIVIIATPLVEFSYSPTELRAAQEISFDGKFLTGSSPITSWKWNFGDENSSISGVKTPLFTYQKEGTYTVSLTAKDAKNDSLVVTQDVTVLAALESPYEASLVWSFSNETAVSDKNDGSSSPIIGDDGVVYYLESYAGGDSKLVAVNDLGFSVSKKWDATLGYNLRNSPSMDAEGNIYIGAWSGSALTKVNSNDGSVLWFGATGQGISNSTVAIDSKNNTYFGTRGKGIQSFDAGGTQRWRYDSSLGGARYYVSPAISADETTVYAMMIKGEIYALNTADGTLKWGSPIAFSGDATGASVSIDADGTIYFTTDSEIIAVTDNGTSGTIKWSYAAVGAESSGIVIGEEGTLYTGTENGLIALNPEDGSLKWAYEGVDVDESVPAVDSKGNIYFGSTDGKLNVLDIEGNLVKSFSLTSDAVHSPVISADGNVYVEGYDGTTITLFKISVEDINGPFDSAWPMKGKNAKSTALAN